MDTTTMSKQEFFDYVKDNIADRFDTPVPVKVKISPIEKLTGVYTGCCVDFRPNEKVTQAMPTANLDEIYSLYSKDDCFDLDRAMNEVCKIVTMPAPSGVDGLTSNIENTLKKYEWVKDHLFMRVANESRVSKDVIQRPIASDLRLIPYIMIECGEQGMSTCAVTSDLIEWWDKDEDTIINDASENGLKLLPMHFENIAHVLFGVDDDDVPFYIVTNDKKVNGASSIFYPSVAEEIGDKFGEDFYIIPSSIHETLVVKKSMVDDPKVLAGMIRAVNRDSVPESDWLSDTPYSYNIETKEYRKEVV